MQELKKESYWYFGTATTIFGENALNSLEDIEGNKILIITDPGLIKLKVVEILTKKLKQFKRKYKIFGEVEPDPKEETILRGRDLALQYKPDLIIGLGGGSSIDAAKAIYALYEKPELNIDDLNPFIKLNLGNKSNLIEIPTTSGTGAECTWAIIITRTLNNGGHIKLEQATREVLPKYAILDPIFTTSLPRGLTIATAFDALGHSYEAILSTWHNEYSSAMSVGAVSIIREWLPKVLENPKNPKGRRKLAIAANQAGIAFGNSQVIFCHSMAHVLGSHTELAEKHLTHGLVVGIMLPYVMEFSINDPVNVTAKQRLAKFGKMIGVAKWNDDAETAARKVIDDYRSFEKKVNAPLSLKEVGVDKDKLIENADLMVQECLDSAVSTSSPRIPTRDEFKKIFLYAWEGNSIDF